MPETRGDIEQLWSTLETKKLINCFPRQRVGSSLGSYERLDDLVLVKVVRRARSVALSFHRLPQQNGYTFIR